MKWALTLGLAATVCSAPLIARADSRAALNAAPESVRQVFTADDDGLTHKPSGMRCPAAIDSAIDTGEGAELSGIVEGNLAGANGQDAVYCTYGAQGRTVAYLSFSRTAEPIDAAWCKALPKALGLNMGPAVLALSGERNYEAPHRLAEMNIANLPTFVCGWSRPPVQRPIIITMVMAAQTQGWTVTAVHAPPAPPGLNGYRSPAVSMAFFLTSLRLLDKAVSPKP